MSVYSLHDLIALLESGHELKRIAAGVDPLLEIAAITNRVCKQPDGGPALLFEKPLASDFRLATNLFGSSQRVCRALGIVDLNELTVSLNGLLQQITKPDFSSLDRQMAVLPGFSSFASHAAEKPDPDLVAMNPPDLTCFPFLQSWPGDGSASGHTRYMTLAQVFTTAPEGANPNCGLYRVQIRGARELAIQWKNGSGGARHAGQYLAAGKPMPVAIVLGGDPAILFSAMFPLPGDLDEIAFAGFLRGQVLRTAPCSTVPLQVPFGAEVVIEGYVEPHQAVMEGPFGNHSGYYSPAAPAALLKVTAIRHRRDAIIPATVVGPPPMEDCWMALAWERLLLAFLQKLLPAVADIHFPFEWVFHQSAIISLENPSHGMIPDMVGQLWRLPWFAAARLLVFVDAASGPIGLRQAAWHCINQPEWRGRLIHDVTGDRTALDATGCGVTRPRLETDKNINEKIEGRWSEYGFA